MSHTNIATIKVILSFSFASISPAQTSNTDGRMGRNCGCLITGRTCCSGMNYPGSTQLGLAKKLLEQYSWSRFVVLPEWADTHFFAAGLGSGV